MAVFQAGKYLRSLCLATIRRYEPQAHSQAPQADPDRSGDGLLADVVNGDGAEKLPAFTVEDQFRAGGAHK